MCVLIGFSCYSSSSYLSYLCSVRGGSVNYHPHDGLYPDAVSNVVHGYAELDKHTDEEVEHIHEVKAATTKKKTAVSDEHYDDDPFFDVLVHNNDDRRVENVSSESTWTPGAPPHDRIDKEMFEKLHHKIHDKIFPPHDEDEKEHKQEPEEKVSYVHGMIEDSNLFD